MSLLDRAARFIDDVLLLPEDVRESIELAEQALDDDLAAEAASLFRDVLRDRPSLLRARQGLAQALAAQGDVDGARAVLTVSRQLDPDEPEVALLSAQLALSAGDIELAVEESRDAARRMANEGGPRFAEACVVRARAERARKRPDRAARELRKAMAADPEAPLIPVELAEALAEAGRGAQAAAVVGRIDVDAVAVDVAARLGLALAEGGEGLRARPLLERAASAGRPEASRALARLALVSGQPSVAEEHARTAVARGGGADALATLAAVLRAQGRSDEATQALLTASDARGGDLELLRRAARLVDSNNAPELIRVADHLDALSVGEPTSRAARSLAQLARGDLAGAEALVEPGSSEPRMVLASAAIATRRGRSQEALDRLSGGIEFEPLDLPRVQQIRRAALRALWRGDTGQVDLAAAIDQVARFTEQRGLGDAHRQALTLRDELDRPLLLAVLGEFNAGKSTLVNAFVGADVAPTGIVPTTATLNVLRSGAERRVRMVRADGTTEEGDYEQLKPMLDAAEEADDAVDHIEITLPSELLERVWILDTPGSNAPVPEHEALAAEALRRADAALWIFDAGQAGKATEGSILRAIRASRRHVVAAVNKVDRLREGQLEQVRASLARELPDLPGEVVALSAKRALKARLAGDEQAFVDSGFPGLLARLEADVFSRSRQLKRRACGGRLIALLDDALATEEGANASHEAAVQALEEASPGLRKAGRGLPEIADTSIRAFERAQEGAFGTAADEVLAFVRPRSNRFAKHGADLEDRAFLAEVIQERLDRAAEDCERRLVAKVRAALSGAAASVGVQRPALDARVRATIAPAMARFVGVQRGLLIGGALRRFFEDDLPRAELEKEPIAEALSAARAHPREHLRPELQEALSELARSLETDRTDAIATLRRDRRAQIDAVYEPLRALRDVLSELVD
ncbi:MAG: dynamin family protein [Sandaracinaceae bacterium]